MFSMIMIPISIKESPIHGLGVYSNDFLPKGTLIWRYNALLDNTFSPEQWSQLKDSLSGPCWERVNRYFFFRGEDRVLVCDGSQFMNHADEEPARNVGSVNSNLDEVFALRNIEAGEELLCNYNEL